MVVLLQFSLGKVCCGVTEACHSNNEQRDNGFTGKEDELFSLLMFECCMDSLSECNYRVP